MSEDLYDKLLIKAKQRDPVRHQKKLVNMIKYRRSVIKKYKAELAKLTKELQEFKKVMKAAGK